MVCSRIGINFKKRVNSLKKEIFRKTIHLCTGFVPVLLHFYKTPVIILLILALSAYLLSEFLRFRGINIPLISQITVKAARKRDENKIVLGPVTLVLGVVSASLLWPETAAAIGIVALALGDGLASLAGKSFGSLPLPFTGGKTVEGSLTCFTAIFVSCWMISKNTVVSFIVALTGCFIECLPLKDFDNLLIPVVLGGLSAWLLNLPFLFPQINLMQGF